MNPLREDIRSSLVQAGQEACGYMNCKLFVQTVIGIPQLDALPSRPFRSIGDLVSGDVLKWGTGQHWAIYIGGGDIMEVEEWGAESRIVPLAEILEEIDPPDTVFSTVTPQREALLRECIRELLTEAAKGPADLPGRIVVHIFEDGNSTRITYAKPIKKQGSGWLYGRSKRPSGIIEIFRPDAIDGDGPCDGAWQVGMSAASPGWGPLLYDVAMEWATLNGGGLVSDRAIVSLEAHGVWDYYMNNRGDVTGIQMDDLDNTLTPEEKDNCNQHSAERMGPEGINWQDSPLSKRWTKPPTGMSTLRKLGKLVES